MPGEQIRRAAAQGGELKGLWHNRWGRVSQLWVLTCPFCLPAFLGMPSLGCLKDAELSVLMDTAATIPAPSVVHLPSMW